MTDLYPNRPENSSQFLYSSNKTKNYTKFHEISQNFTKFIEITRNFTKLQEISRNFTKIHENSLKLTKFHEISRNFTNFHKIPRNFTKFEKNSKKNRKISLKTSGSHLLIGQWRAKQCRWPTQMFHASIRDIHLIARLYGSAQLKVYWLNTIEYELLLLTSFIKRHGALNDAIPTTAFNSLTQSLLSIEKKNVPMINDIEVWQKEFVLFYWTINRKMEFHSSNARRDFEASTLFVYCTNSLFFFSTCVHSAHCKFTQIFYII